MLHLVKYIILYLSTSGECGSVLFVVLNLSILPDQQTSQLLHLLLQHAAHHQQGAHQLSTRLRRTD